MIEIVIIIIVAICLTSTFFFVYKWYSLYAKFKGLTLNDVITEGYYRPKY